MYLCLLVVVRPLGALDVGNGPFLGGAGAGLIVRALLVWGTVHRCWHPCTVVIADVHVSWAQAASARLLLCSGM